ncbi:MAG: hypothetical protein CVU22_04240 [Betaproteobacteria bacterium HGW-Betaproteobacteria-16]|nr:MAG: hypothetical protein CVU22_04240 [Betaproteobacteria bacterium HGW-Betaproteobacteria-16]
MNEQFPAADGQRAVFNDNMPRLSSGLSRGVNKMAVAYVVLVSLAVIGATLWITSSAFSADDKKKRVTFEEVEVPKKPEFRPAPPPPPPAKSAAALPVSTAPLPPVPEPLDDLLERRMANQDNLVAAQQGQGNKSPFFQDEFSSVKRGAVQQLANADFTLTRGTFIRCALETKVVSTHPGMTSCIVTEPIYSVNGRRLLVDKGSKVTGEYKYLDEHFDRIGIVWTRILTTTGLDVRIDSAGTDSLGGAGVPGIYDGHWGERIGAALLVSLLADTIDAGAQKFADRNDIRGRETTQYDSDGRVASTRVDPWESHTATTTKRAATEMLSRSANRKATVTVLNGTVVNIFAARDVDFSSVMR